MIVTFDSSILVRATKRSRGPAREVVNAVARCPDHVILLLPYILGEVGKALSYPRLQILYGLTADDIHVVRFCAAQDIRFVDDVGLLALLR